jgi:hypothetical protein
MHPHTKAVRIYNRTRLGIYSDYWIILAQKRGKVKDY